MRRRVRFLRQAREIAFRDLGGLVFDLRRFRRQRFDLVEAKLQTLAVIDGELRTLETALRDRRPVMELREAGIGSCPRCSTIIASDANFCSYCGLQVGNAPVISTTFSPSSSTSTSPATPPPAPDATPTAPETGGAQSMTAR